MNASAKRPSGQRTKKRKFTGNMHTRSKIESVSGALNHSASGRKIQLLDSSLESNSCFEGYRIFDKQILFTNIQNHLSCKKCGGDVTVLESSTRGLSSTFSFDCKNCSLLCSFRNSEMLGKKKNIPEINRRFTYAMRSIGRGHSATETFCGVMDFPPPIAVKSYNAMVNKLLSCTREVSEASMMRATSEEIALTSSSDIVISGDGTWKTRGHTSLVGVCTVVGDKCGKVIDTEVLSSYCKGCDSWKRRKGSPAYKNWSVQHEALCLKNHTGSAGKMETVGMVRIFQRSEDKRSARYVSYIGDGDAKTFLSVVESQPYDDISITKLECVGHIQKRMGTRLRKLKQTHPKLSDGKSISGRGRLTDKVIDLMSNYYGNAIRSNKDNLSAMRKAVWAVFFHLSSTDDEPLHSFCPLGSDSWCKYQRNVAEGSIETFKHAKKLPAVVMQAIKPIFNDLSQPKLLQRCLGGKTQNNNESINSLIWKLCPKTLGCGRKIVEIATNEAIVLFNEGNSGRLQVMETFGLTVGSNARNFVSHMDKKRIETAERHFNLNTREVRQAKRMRMRDSNNTLIAQEGTTYAAGEF